MAAYVSHIVAKYERGVVAKLVEKLYGEAAGGRGNGRLLTRHSTGVAVGGSAGRFLRRLQPQGAAAATTGNHRDLS